MNEPRLISQTYAIDVDKSALRHLCLLERHDDLPTLAEDLMQVPGVTKVRYDTTRPTVYVETSNKALMIAALPKLFGNHGLIDSEGN